MEFFNVKKDDIITNATVKHNTVIHRNAYYTVPFNSNCLTIDYRCKDNKTTFIPLVFSG